MSVKSFSRHLGPPASTSELRFPSGHPLDQIRLTPWLRRTGGIVITGPPAATGAPALAGMPLETQPGFLEAAVSASNLTHLGDYQGLRSSVTLVMVTNLPLHFTWFDGTIACSYSRP